jgi:hypothetical protein
MEAWALIFRNLYTGFLLRDFAGKIVPGMVLLFSLVALFREPGDLYEDARKEVPLFLILLLADFCWITTLGIQSLAEGIGIWQYFSPSSAPVAPSGSIKAAPKPPFWKDLILPAPDPTFDKDTLEVDEFQSKATEDEKQQYERFVVIKEACGNLFVALVLSTPAWMVRFARRKGTQLVRMSKPLPWLGWNPLPAGRTIVCAIYFALLLVGLHRMHLQHGYRQIKFAEDLLQKHKNIPETRPQTIHLKLEQK